MGLTGAAELELWESSSIASETLRCCWSGGGGPETDGAPPFAFLPESVSGAELIMVIGLCRKCTG